MFLAKSYPLSEYQFPYLKGDIAKGTVQYAYIFLEFFIPISVAFFVMFGGEENVKLMKNEGISDDKIKQYSTISETVRHLSLFVCLFVWVNNLFMIQDNNMFARGEVEQLCDLTTLTISD